MVAATLAVLAAAMKMVKTAPVIVHAVTVSVARVIASILIPEIRLRICANMELAGMMSRSSQAELIILELFLADKS